MGNISNLKINTKLLEETETLLATLFPICRSITGNGVRKSLSILRNISNFQINEIESETKCFDWEIPDEWNVDSAFLEDENGKKILDFKENNLHLVNYSIPVDKIISFEELKKHIHTLSKLPKAIPYRTTYYSKNWGFCMSFEQFQSLDPNLKYHACIRTTLKPGAMTYGEERINGNSGIEFIISTYCCHPSLANDNLSGIILWILLLRELKKRKTTHSYRFVIVPETIGAIAYLAKNKDNVKNIVGGYILTCVAGSGKYGYKESFLGNHIIDKISRETLNESENDYNLYKFDINGSDETQFSSPYFRIPIGTVCKDKYYEYEYYHTSLDDLKFIDAKNIINSLEIYLKIIEKLENHSKLSFKKIDEETKDDTSQHIVLRSLNPYCEPMLSKRGLYPTIGGHIMQKPFKNNDDHMQTNYSIDNDKENLGIEIDAISWLMFYADEKTSVEMISKKSKLPITILKKTIEKLKKYNLIEEIK